MHVFKYSMWWKFKKIQALSFPKWIPVIMNESSSSSRHKRDVPSKRSSNSSLTWRMKQCTSLYTWTCNPRSSDPVPWPGDLAWSKHDLRDHVVLGPPPKHAARHDHALSNNRFGSGPVKINYWCSCDLYIYMYICVYIYIYIYIYI